MSGFKCPFCDQIMSETGDTHKIWYLSFDNAGTNYTVLTQQSKFVYSMELHKCPSCGKITIVYHGLKGQDINEDRKIYPSVICNQYPDYIPKQIRSDYEEACSIVNLSPKASATLSRRCLQGMIRDFWGIKKNRLVEEIDALQGKIPAAQWSVIDKVRKIGNIGAHMEKDVNYIIDIDPSEAQKLIKLIELLIKSWYISRYEEEQLYADIKNIGDEKDKQKHTN